MTTFIKSNQLPDFLKPFSKKESKYKNKKYQASEVGIVFDSKREFERYCTLQLLLKSGLIKDLELQKKFLIQDGFTTKLGIKIRPIHYIADFYYYDNDLKSYVIEDCKGFRTKDYIIKSKLMMFKYPDCIFLES